jgi:hypothetical protein
MALSCKQVKHFNLTIQRLGKRQMFFLFGNSKIGSRNYVYPKTPKGTKSPEMEISHSPPWCVSEMQDVYCY